MRQIISFKKELLFKTKVSDITSISLEREIKVEDSIITGIFHITGDYKINEGSINREEFSFDLPFDITIDPRYDINTIEADIDDFHYDLINNDTLKVNIDLYIEAEYLPEQTTSKEDFKEPEVVEEEILPIKEDNSDDRIELAKETNEEKIDRDSENDLFSNLDNSETYSTYYVYIVKEEDNIDKILNKYDITKEELESYNDISNINVGDKLIIPKCNE